MLKYYTRNANAMGLAPLEVGDVGVVRGESTDMPHRKTVAVKVDRTNRMHEIECFDLVTTHVGPRKKR